MTTYGIDVSKHQDKIDWLKVKASGKVQYAILRAGLGRLASQKDETFERNYANAKAAGIPIGAYWYSYALTPQEAEQEADACIQCLKGKQFEYPIWYDVEDKTQTGLSQKTLTAIAEAFMKKLEAAGYWVGLYTFYSMASKFSVDVRSRYAFWLAHVNVKKSPYKYPYGMWQYSWTGKIAGINGDVDLDECYVDYPTQIKAKGLNGFTATPATPAQPVMKSVDEVAHEVIDGKWGNGDERKKKLTAAGYDYDKVQEIVRNLMNPAPAASVPMVRGTKVRLAGKLFSSATATSGNTKTATYYLYDGVLVNGRYRLTTTKANCGRMPIGSYVTGWADKSDLTVVG